MADLITKVARDNQSIELHNSSHSRSGTGAKPSIVIHTQKDVIVATSGGELDEDHYSQNSSSAGRDNDERPLKEAAWGNGHHEATATAN